MLEDGESTEYIFTLAVRWNDEYKRVCDCSHTLWQCTLISRMIVLSNFVLNF